MSDNEKEAKKSSEVKKPSFFKGLKAEFRKINWPSKKTITKESGAVLVITIVLMGIIVVVDYCLEFGLNVLLGL